MEGENRRFDSFEELYKTYYKQVYSYIYRSLRNNEAAAEDLAQEVFLVAYRKWETLREHPNVPGFLMLTAKNKILAWLDDQKRDCSEQNETLDNLVEDKGEAMEDENFRQVDLYYSLETFLSEKELAILRQYYEYGYTSAEMAKKQGVSESCFKMRILRIKKKLRGCLSVWVMFLLGLGL